MQEGKDYTNFGCCAFWRTCELGKKACVYATSNPAKQSACGVFRNKPQALTTDVQSVKEEQELIRPIVDSAQEKLPLYRSNRHGQFTLF